MFVGTGTSIGWRAHQVSVAASSVPHKDSRGAYTENNIFEYGGGLTRLLLVVRSLLRPSSSSELLRSMMQRMLTLIEDAIERYSLPSSAAFDGIVQRASASKERKIWVEPQFLIFDRPANLCC